MLIRVALADDHPLVRATLRRLLSLRKDIELVCEAVNGQEAVDCVNRFNPDVLVMDISMPVMDGFEATQQIVTLKVHTQIILISLDTEHIFVSKANQCPDVRLLGISPLLSALPHR